MSVKKTHHRGTVSYLINDFNDLRDVVLTIERMIAETTEVRNKTVLREACRMSIVPLKDRCAYILQIKLHEAMLK